MNEYEIGYKMAALAWREGHRPGLPQERSNRNHSRNGKEIIYLILKSLYYGGKMGIEKICDESEIGAGSIPMVMRKLLKDGYVAFEMSNRKKIYMITDDGIRRMHNGIMN